MSKKEKVSATESSDMEEEEQLTLSAAGKRKLISSKRDGERVVFSTPGYRVANGEDKVPLWKKLAYATGSMPYAMCNTVVAFYFSIFLLEVVILDPTFVLVIIFTGRVWDAITDPVVGYLTSVTKTRFGRLKPWLVLSMLPAATLYFFLWYVPPLDEHPQVYKYIYYQVIYLLFQAALTCIHVPFTALTVHISNSSKERDSVTLYRMCFEVAGTLIGIIVYTVFYVGLVRSSSNQCDSGERVPDPDERAAYRYHGLTLAVLLVVCVSVTALGVKEQQDEVQTDKKIGILKGLKQTCGFKPYFYLLLLELFSWLSLSFITGNTALFVKYSVGLEDEYPYVIAVLLVSSILFMPLWQYIILKYGKKTAFFVGMWTLLPLLLCQLYVDKLPRISYFLMFLGGLGVGCFYLIPWSMLPDVIDQALLKHGIRREELFYAFFVFGNKFSTGITLGISTGIYKIVGYNERSCEQPWTVPLTLKLLVTVPPVFFILIALIFLHLYPITEETRRRTKRLLAERNNEPDESEDGVVSNAARHVGPTTMAVAAKTNRPRSRSYNEGTPPVSTKTLPSSLPRSQQTDL